MGLVKVCGCNQAPWTNENTMQHDYDYNLTFYSHDQLKSRMLRLIDDTANMLSDRNHRAMVLRAMADAATELLLLEAEEPFVAPRRSKKRAGSKQEDEHVTT